MKTIDVINLVKKNIKTETESINKISKLYSAACELNRIYPEILGPDDENYNYPEADLEKAYCSFLEAILRELWRLQGK